MLPTKIGAHNSAEIHYGIPKNTYYDYGTNMTDSVTEDGDCQSERY